MSAHILVVFVLTCAGVSLLPGPNMLYAMSLGVRFGPRRAMAGGAGLALALGGMALVSALGLGALVATSELAFEIVRWVGVVYLVWIGVHAWRAPGGNIGGGRSAGGDGRAWRMFLRGLFVSASNPKAMVFLTALFPQFIDTTAPLAPQLVVLVITMMSIEFASIMVYAFGGGTLAARLTDASAARVLNRVTGGLLIGAGGLLAMARAI